MNEKFDCSKYIARTFQKRQLSAKDVANKMQQNLLQIFALFGTVLQEKMQQMLLKQCFCLLQNFALFVNFYLAAVATIKAVGCQ